MTDSPWSHPVRLNAPGAREGREVKIEPDADTRAAVAEELGIVSVRKLRLQGRLTPEGRNDWRFDGELGATVVQPCGVTLEPVSTRLDEPVTRRWLADMPEAPEGGEVEMPEDETAEPLRATVDLGAVMVEALALALPPFPRAPGAELGEAVYAEPGRAPLTDEALRPFAGLSSLRDKLTGRDDEG